MNDYLTKINELHSEAYGLPNGASKVALLEEAVRLADTHNDIPVGYDMRDALVEAATFSGYPEKALVAFSWCLSQADKNAELVDEFTLLWKYKWIIDSLPGFPQITRRQITDMVDDMKQRFQRAGAGERAAAKLECNIAFDFGEREQAWRLFHHWQGIRRDFLSDCRACEQDDIVGYNCDYGNDEESLHAAKLIFSGRSLRCAEVPHRTYAKVLLPLFRLGRLDEAAEHHRKGYRMVSGNAKFLRQQACHLEFVVLTDNLARGCRIFERHIRSAFESANKQWTLEFLTVGLLLMKRMQPQGHETCLVRLPKTAPIFRDDGTYEISTVIDWLNREVSDLAARFDRRNENDFYTNWIKRADALADSVQPYPLSR